MDGAGDLMELSAADRFLLDSVDGLSCVDDLSMMLGMSVEDVAEGLTRLVAAGFVTVASDAIEETTHSAAGRELELTASFEVGDLLAQITPPTRPSLPPPISGSRPMPTPPPRGLRGATPPPLARPPVGATSVRPRTDASGPRRVPTDDHDAVETTSSATGPRPIPDGHLPPLKRPPSAVGLPRPLPSAPQRASAPTPRRHLDTSWWNGVDSLEEPDERLTSREISHSGLRGIGRTLGSSSHELRLSSPDTARLRESQDTDRVDVVDQSFTEPMANLRGAVIAGHAEAESTADLAPPVVHQHDTPPPGGFLRPSSHAQMAHPTAPVEPVFADDASDVAAVTAVTTQVDPFDDDAGGTLRHPILTASMMRAADEPPVAADSRWADEPLHATLKADRGDWTVVQARCVSYFSRLAQNATFYELLGISNDADRAAIDHAAQEFRRTFAAMDLRREQAPHARELVQAIDRGLDRALEVLLDADARARYNAALDALAAFSATTRGT